MVTILLQLGPARSKMRKVAFRSRDPRLEILSLRLQVDDPLLSVGGAVLLLGEELVVLLKESQR